MTNQRRMKEPEIMKGLDKNLQLYARANAPCRDYYGLTITESNLILNVWRVSYGPHIWPKQKHCIFDEFKTHKMFQEEVKLVFGEGVFDYLTGLTTGQKKLENLPRKLFLRLFWFLGIDDVFNLMSCSKIIYELCNQEDAWRIVFIKKFGRAPSREENVLAMNMSWKDIFKKRLDYVRKALKNTNENTMKKKRETKKSIRK
ncbi:unnamed protein product [Ceutorhynchus assimilis]|uniref:F-box domain-containing protein n=1 Tax=Ceutorhynchus assimilis TaxID=467358 RepID=A0A9P0GT49_9CUCU|nr:unnamed protein product [Ceutorhynchus assimilis]